MREICLILDFSSGCASSSAATFVSGPVGMIVTGSGDSRSTFAMSSTAVRPQTSIAGSGSAGPSKPDSPCTDGAFITSAVSGCGQPSAMGASMPSSVQTRSVL